jgi:hypothetical protein
MSESKKSVPAKPDYELPIDDPDFVNGLITQLANASATGTELNPSGLTFMLSVVKGVKPRDQLEAMLAAQMAAVHMASMTFTQRLNNVENIPQQDSAAGALNKLMRTYATQMEALKRYRTGGEQKMTVQHVTVSEGGQAIVGNLTQSPRETAVQTAQPALTHTPTEPLPILGERTKAPVSVRQGRKI